MKTPSTTALPGTLLGATVLGAAVLCAAVHRVDAQLPQPVRLLGEVRGEGSPLPDAGAVFHSATQPRLVALTDWPELLPPAPPRRTVTDGRGRFRIDLGPADSAVLEGVLEIRHPAGPDANLGALVFRPGPVSMVTCRPMAEIGLPGECDVHIQAIDRDGRGFYLGRRHGVDRVRLPAATYRFLLLGDSFALEYSSIRLRPGHRHELPQTKLAARELTLPTGDAPEVRLRHWPHVALPSRRGRVALPAGEAPLRLLVIEPLTGCRSFREIWASGPVTQIGKPRSEARTHSILVRTAAGQPIPEARVIAMHPGITLQIASHAVTDVKGRAKYATTANTTTQLLVFAPGFVSTARVLHEEWPESIALDRGESLRLQVLDPHRQPGAHVDVEFVRDDQPLLRSKGRTDTRGIVVRNDLPPGSISVRLRHPKFLDEEHTIRITPKEPNHRTVRARPGFQVHGRVLLPGGRAAPGAVVTLRDTTGRTGLVRTVVTDNRGGFRITGLPEHFRLRLSAQLDTPRGAFISEHRLAVPDGASYELDLRSEDPRFPGRKKQ